MNYSAIKNYDIANGKGVRVSLFVSGCNHHCKGCFNQETWDFNHGEPFTDETIMEIIEMLKPDYINGLTVLGGEPLDPKNIKEVYRLIMSVRNTYGDTKNIWVYTGYTYEELADRSKGCYIEDEHRYSIDSVISHLISNIDILVDGRFIEEKKNISLAFKGSENQRIIDCKKSIEYSKGYPFFIIINYPDSYFKK